MSRTLWSGRLMFIITLAGATIGYGAAWRFPYLVGQNGGGAFLLIFLLIMILFGLPVLIAETLIGRKSHTNVIDSFSGDDSNGKAISKKWKSVGYLSIFGAFAIMTYYVVISAWVMEFIVGMTTGALDLSQPMAKETASSFYDNAVASPFRMMGYSLIFIIASYVILVKGIKGIEKSMKYLMPLLLLIVVLMAIRGVTLEGAIDGIKFYTIPDFSKITTNTILACFGQAFFGLSLGFGVMITLGSYVNKKENIFVTSTTLVLINIIVPFLIGFIIFPPIFAFGLEPTEGASLVFKVLPLVFSNMPLGTLVAFMFFFLLLLDALTTSITIYEVAITAISEKLKISRTKATVLTLGTFFVLGNIPVILSGSIWADVRIIGRNIFDAFDYISANILFILTSFLSIIYLAYVLKKKLVIKELTNEGELSNFYKKSALVWFYYIKYVVPVLIILLFIISI